jgi:hypothetical protein
LARVLPFKLPGSVLSSSFKLIIFSPFTFSFSGSHVALGQRGMMALVKALVGFCFLGIGFGKELVMIDC